MRLLVLLENVTGLTLIGRRKKSTGWQMDYSKHPSKNF